MDTAPSTSGSSSPSNSGSVDTDGMFIKHKVSKMDTLAGLAIRYNVSVADIKMANGLLSDTAMFGRGTVLIPKQQLHLGQDVHMMVAQIFSGVGRDRLLNADARLSPGSSAMTLASNSQAAAQEAGQSMMGGDADWLASCSTCGEDWLSQPPPLTHTKRHSSQPGQPVEVEMMDRSPKSSSYAGGRGDDRIRRRRREGESLGDSYSDLTTPTIAEGYTFPSSLPPRGPAGPPPFRSTSGGFWGNLSSLSKSISESSVVKHIKKVASQPALATHSTHSFADAADAVLSSVHRQNSASASAAQDRSALMRLVEPAPPRRKEGGKAE